ncbi:MAG: (2Fe-2S)-binding protein [Ilumatobacteraceae bacterium]
MTDHDPAGTAPESLTYTLNVNGAVHDVHDASVNESLLYVLRERVGLTGTKGACEQGECGSCSVLIDGELVCACLVLAATAQGQAITTVEGLDSNGVPNDVQTAFVEAGAVQCGFCTPGLIMATEALLADNASPSELEVREALSGNICRCTGYGRILDAVARTVAVRQGGGA